MSRKLGNLLGDEKNSHICVKNVNKYSLYHPHYINVNIILLSVRYGALLLLFKMFQVEKKALVQEIIIKSYFLKVSQKAKYLGQKSFK